MALGGTKNDADLRVFDATDPRPPEPEVVHGPLPVYLPHPMVYDV